MKKNFKEYVKKAVAVVAMAAAVVTVVPQVAEARTPSDAGCTGNSSGYHAYQFYCVGFSRYTPSGSHIYYESTWDMLFNRDNSKECIIQYVYHNGIEQCQYCSKPTSVFAEHCDNAIHKSCGKGNVDYGYCNGLGSQVTIITSN